MSGKKPLLDDKTIEALVRLQENFQKQIKEVSKPLAKFLCDVQPVIEKMSHLIRQLSELYVQYKSAFTEGISNFDIPEIYNPANVTIHPWTEQLAIRVGLELMDELPSSPLSFMSDRYIAAFEGYLNGEYQLAAFTFISMIDGMLHEFYDEHKGLECLPNYDKRRPFNRCLGHLKRHYKMDIFVGSAEFESRLTSFFKHRNEIMHGGKFSHFDKNICTIALLFLAVTFASISR